MKNSGYGRELSVQGIREFCNIKAVWIGSGNGHDSDGPAATEQAADPFPGTEPRPAWRWRGRSSTGPPGHLRYDGLQEWASKITALAGDADDTHVLFNNCYRDYAQVNAQLLQWLLTSTDTS